MGDDCFGQGRFDEVLREYPVDYIRNYPLRRVAGISIREQGSRGVDGILVGSKSSRGGGDKEQDTQPTSRDVVDHICWVDIDVRREEDISFMIHHPDSTLSSDHHALRASLNSPRQNMSRLCPDRLAIYITF